MTQVQVRLIAGAIVFVAAALALNAPEKRLQALRNFFFEPSSPVNLAALRAIVYGMILRTALESDAVWLSSLPTSLMRLPPGWGWAFGGVWFDPGVVAAARIVLIVAAACATLGLLTRVAAPIAALAAVYVLGIPNFYMKIDHANHALVMCALTLAFSPCADVLSLDRLWLRRKGYAVPASSSAYTIPVRLCWMFVGTVYLFPGLWKLWDSGDLWISGVKLQYEMRSKWSQLPDFLPLARIDKSPFWTSVFGTATLVFEIGFFFALFNRVTRVIAAFSAVGFHLGVKYIMGIQFHTYFPLILLLDFPQLWHALRPYLPAALAQRVDATIASVSAPVPAAPSPERARPAPARAMMWPAPAIGIVLVLAQFVTGLARIDTWPVAVHPTFSLRRDDPPTTGRTTLLILEPKAGGEKRLNDELARIGNARLVRLLRKLRSVHRPSELKKQGKMIVGLFHASGVSVAPGDHISIHEASWDLFPLGARTRYRQKLVQRYAVTGDLALATGD